MRILVVLTLASLVWGCSPPPVTPSPTPSAATTAGEEHEHAAPHGGTLIVFGEEAAHLELVLDPARGRLTGYVLDGEAEKSLRVAQESIDIRLTSPKPVRVTLIAVENELTGETQGDSSEFRGESADLKGLSRFEASLARIQIQG
ncbi:MAG: hypothetical protein AB1758_30685, partial [Candidatus Eremiobacterota bacterium]